MPNPIYAMDTAFHHSLGNYPFETRCAMLADLGYDGTYVTLWSEQAWRDVEQFPGVRERFGIEVTSVYGTLDIAADEDHADNRRLIELVDRLEGCDTLELAIRSSDESLAPSDPQADEAAAPWLGELVNRAASRGITIALYPHIRFWLERIEDAVRLCRRLEHPNLRAVFCGYHWYAIDRQGLPDRLALAAPYLHRVNVCGSRPNPPGPGMPATIEPLDAGELDHCALFGQLRKIGYTGPIGIQGYSTGGDVYANLRRSLAAYREIHQRLDEHPEWAELNWAKSG